MDYIKKGRNMKLSELLKVVECESIVDILLVDGGTLYEGFASGFPGDTEKFLVVYLDAFYNTIICGVRWV